MFENIQSMYRNIRIPFGTSQYGLVPDLRVEIERSWLVLVLIEMRAITSNSRCVIPWYAMLHALAPVVL
jgi:hypothetical protein